MYESFFNHLMANYGRYCMEKEIAPDNANLLSYLKKKGFFQDEAVRKYVLIREFEYVNSNKLHKNKTQRVKMLAEKFELHESTVWGALKKKI